MLFEFFLFSASVFTSTLSALVGAVGGVVLLASMTLGMPHAVAVPLHGLIQLLSNSLRAFYLRKNIIRKIFISFCIGAPFGSAFAYFFITSLTSEKIPLLFIVSLIFYTLFKPEKMPQLILRPWQFGILGFVSGFLGILVGATGPLLAPFFLRKDFSKEQIVSTQSSCQIVTHLLKVPVFLTLGFKYLNHLDLILIMFLGTIIGTSLGIHALKLIKTNLFIISYKLVLGAVALKLLLVNVLELISI